MVLLHFYVKNVDHRMCKIKKISIDNDSLILYKSFDINILDIKSFFKYYIKATLVNIS